MLEEVIQLASEAKVKFKSSEFNISKNFLKLNLKAYIARSVYGAKGFYPLVNQGDEIYMQALSMFDKAAKLENDGKIVKAR